MVEYSFLTTVVKSTPHYTVPIIFIVAMTTLILATESATEDETRTLLSYDYESDGEDGLGGITTIATNTVFYLIFCYILWYYLDINRRL